MKTTARSKTILSILLFAACFFASTNVFALSSLPATPMQAGATGPHIQLLQENLIELKLYTYPADGVYSVNTAAAVRALQTLLSLPATGICDEATIAAFNAAINTNSIAIPVGNLPTEASALPLAGKCIGIDPGHQKTPDDELEPTAPGSSGAAGAKPRMSAGGVGIKSGIPEYETNLLIANKLKQLLENAGAAVVMTRAKNEVSISNIERAELMNKAKVDCWVRIHCDYSGDKSKNGISILSPSGEHTAAISEASLGLAKAILPALCTETNAKQLSIAKKSDQTAFNWSSRPVVAVEMGFLSNASEDVLLNRSSYQQLCANGLSKGIIAYFLNEN